MAIAAGVAVPPVYILEEPGINAFAAGYAPGDAVVAVSQGCLEYLTRDELQGVVAHEFSHILNGDMRLNIRLIGLLFGIMALTIVGRILLQTAGGRSASSSSDQRNSGGGQVILGLGLLVLGLVGAFFGRLIQAAVSRQREYLAPRTSGGRTS
jgi:Zn-dependent protease with chaperone function